MSKFNKQIIPLSEPNIKGKGWKLLKECLDTDWVSSAGKFVDKFENEICKYSKAKYAVACVNGTSGLFIALKILWIQGNDEVIVPALTFIAPANAVRYLNAEPVFMDCDNYMNLDPDKLSEFCKKECRMTKNGLKNKRSGRIIKAVIPVHVFGNPCDMDGIMNVARKYRLKVIEDATESIGAYYTANKYKGKLTGAIGDFGVYSFNGNKIITSGGGGMVITNDKTSAVRARYIINQAKDDPVRYIHNEVGYNLRLSNLQAALGLVQLGELEHFIKIKKRNFKLYSNELKGLKGIELLDTPAGTMPNFWFYSLIIEKKEYGRDKEELMRILTLKNIQTRPIWYPNHLQRPYVNNQAYKIEKTLWYWERVLNIPCSTSLKEAQVKYVASIIRESQKMG